jgi:hypothetical protein
MRTYPEVCLCICMRMNIPMVCEYVYTYVCRHIHMYFLDITLLDDEELNAYISRGEYMYV